MVSMRVTGEIMATDASSELMERFADRLMEALVSAESVKDPFVGGSLAAGTLEVTFNIQVGSPAEGWSRGPALLFKAVQDAGMRPLHDWTDVLGVSNRGMLEGEAGALQRLVSHEQLLRSVRSELITA